MSTTVDSNPRFMCPYCRPTEVLSRDLFKHLHHKHPLDFWSERNKKAMATALSTAVLNRPIQLWLVNCAGKDMPLYLSPYNHTLYMKKVTAEKNCAKNKNVEVYIKNIKAILEPPVSLSQAVSVVANALNPNETLALRKILGVLVREIQMEAEDVATKDAEIAMLRKELLKHITESDLEALEAEEVEEPKAIDISLHPLTKEHAKHVKSFSFSNLGEARNTPYSNPLSP